MVFPDNAVISVTGLRLIGNFLAMTTGKVVSPKIQHPHAFSAAGAGEPAANSSEIALRLRQTDPVRSHANVYSDMVIECFDKSFKPNLTVLSPIQPLPVA
jgi:hypothetical protein